MYYTKEYLKRAHREINTIFRVLFPEHGMAVREEQIMLCHEMLDNLLGRNIALCDLYVPSKNAEDGIFSITLNIYGLCAGMPMHIVLA